MYSVLHLEFDQNQFNTITANRGVKKTRSDCYNGVCHVSEPLSFIAFVLFLGFMYSFFFFFSLPFKTYSCTREMHVSLNARVSSWLWCLDCYRTQFFFFFFLIEFNASLCVTYYFFLNSSSCQWWLYDDGVMCGFPLSLN